MNLTTDSKVRAIVDVTSYAIRRGVFRCRRHRTPSDVFDAAWIVWTHFDVEALRTVVAFLCDCDPLPPTRIVRDAFYIRRLLPELAEREEEMRRLLAKQFAA